MSDVIHWTEETVIRKDPNAQKFRTIDGARHLAAGAEFDSGEFTVTSPLEDDDGILEIDQIDVVPSPTSGVANRGVQFRMRYGTAGVAYTVTFRYTTTETPPQIDDHSFVVQVAEK